MNAKTSMTTAGALLGQMGASPAPQGRTGAQHFAKGCVKRMSADEDATPATPAAGQEAEEPPVGETPERNAKRGSKRMSAEDAAKDKAEAAKVEKPEAERNAKRSKSKKMSADEGNAPVPTDEADAAGEPKSPAVMKPAAAASKNSQGVKAAQYQAAPKEIVIMNGQGIKGNTFTSSRGKGA